ncbi:sigma-54 interaction domain-containing protein [Alkalihalobacillus pseudalcaliphilus]|uniref:sigma-54 interaction domain-containing protein n=1 Tax=Alkalihalobacillus pseudalcaliphilus TaxID=79884 RepID=UPI00064E0655|nr:sigma 54-interacting transcriptional regulator [Alkalihalobacillus pseudalcaliphilus]KMK75164.1 Fis family transcriptional regulator [Alkalihalobacillus pseudalcaliphilus]
MELKNIFNSIQDGILVIDNRGIVVMVNKEYEAITGVKKNEIIGKYLIDVRPQAKLVRTLNDEQVRIGVYRQVGNREYFVDMAPIYEDGKVIGAVSVCKGKEEVNELQKEITSQRIKIEQLERKVHSSYQVHHHFESIIGFDRGLTEMVESAKKAASVPFSVLITGESGTGKELFAQAIHKASERAKQPFVPINCATIPKDLVESELFGYEKGAFTSAKNEGKMGLFEIAHQGTLFLDEIGELPLSLQSKLLRVLQEGKIRKLGSVRERSIDTRIIAATNQNLRDLIKKGLFRDDLFYRFCVIQLNIPSLRQRKEDIPLLFKHFLLNSVVDMENDIEMTDEVLAILLEYNWPGNVRELKNTAQYVISMMEGRILKKEHLPQHLHQKSLQTYSSFQQIESLPKMMKKMERDIISEILKDYPNDMEGKRMAAKRLGISVATLYNKLKT